MSSKKKKKSKKKDKKKDLGPIPPFSRSKKFDGIVPKSDYPKDELKEEEVKKMGELLELAKTWDICKESKKARKYVESEVNRYRYLFGFNWNMKKAAKSMKMTVEWRVNYEPEYCYKKPQFHAFIKKYPKLLNFDFGFSYGFDKEGHPIAFLKPVEEKNIRPKGKARMCWFFDLSTMILEDIIAHMPKGIHKLTFVVDVSGLNIIKHSRLLPGYLKKFACHSEYYCELLHRALVVNANTVIRGMWKVITPFLYKETVEKYQFCKDCSILKKYIDDDQIITRLGGTCTFRYRLKEHLEYQFKEKGEDMVEAIEARRQVLLARKRGEEVKEDESEEEEDGEEDEMPMSPVEDEGEEGDDDEDDDDEEEEESDDDDEEEGEESEEDDEEEKDD